MTTIFVEPINMGKKLNDLMNKYNNAKTEKHLESIKKQVVELRYGTYQQYTIIDLFENFPIVSTTPSAKMIKDDFLHWFFKANKELNQKVEL